MRVSLVPLDTCGSILMSGSIVQLVLHDIGVWRCISESTQETMGAISLESSFCIDIIFN